MKYNSKETLYEHTDSKKKYLKAKTMEVDVKIHMKSFQKNITILFSHILNELTRV